MKMLSTIVMPVAKYEIKVVSENTKAGETRKKWKRVKVADEQEMQGFIISYRGQEHVLYVPTAHMRSGDLHTTSWCCDEHGEVIQAIWQHGHSGQKEHIEPALFDWRVEQFVRKTSYHYGQFNDPYKYLRRVLFNDYKNEEK